jgi:hypothetical protein
VRRAALTIYYQAAESCDDSYGTLGDVAGEALADYVHADWPASGIAPEVFWRDILELSCMLSNFGLLHRREVDLLSAAGAKHDLDVVEPILTELHADYTSARISRHADELLALHAYTTRWSLPRQSTGSRPPRQSWDHGAGWRWMRWCGPRRSATRSMSPAGCWTPPTWTIPTTSVRAKRCGAIPPRSTSPHQREAARPSSAPGAARLTRLPPDDGVRADREANCVHAPDRPYRYQAASQSLAAVRVPRSGVTAPDDRVLQWIARVDQPNPGVWHTFVDPGPRPVSD